MKALNKSIQLLLLTTLISACGGGGGDSGSNTNSAAANDRDSDGVADTFDNCPNTPNPTQVDDDGDRIGNACETSTNVMDDNGVTDGTGMGNESTSGGTDNEQVSEGKATGDYFNGYRMTGYTLVDFSSSTSTVTDTVRFEYSNNRAEAYLRTNSRYHPFTEDGGPSNDEFFLATIRTNSVGLVTEIQGTAFSGSYAYDEYSKYEYDNNGLLTGINTKNPMYADLEEIDIRYDSAGRLVQMQKDYNYATATTRTDILYNGTMPTSAMGNHSNDDVNEDIQIASITSNSNGNITNLFYTAGYEDGMRNEYRYDSNGNLEQIDEYNATGILISRYNFSYEPSNWINFSLLINYPVPKTLFFDGEYLGPGTDGGTETDGSGATDAGFADVGFTDSGTTDSGGTDGGGSIDLYECDVPASEFSWNVNCELSTSYGGYSATVKGVQHILWCAGYGQNDLNVFADGFFGPITESAVTEFQSALNLLATGVVDSATWAQLQSLLEYLSSRSNHDRFSASEFQIGIPACEEATFTYQQATSNWFFFDGEFDRQFGHISFNAILPIY